MSISLEKMINAEKLLLDVQGEEPIIQCDFDCIDEEVQESEDTLSYEEEYLKCFHSHCDYAAEFLNAPEAMALKDEYTSVWGLEEPWRELAKIYAIYGYPAYASDTCLEVYKPGSHFNEDYAA
ncbi:hypothetical protein JCM30760_26990 [Thiomicrorhabdus hydrogeniphila]